MKATVSLRLRPSRTEFLVFFPFSNGVVRGALLAAGIRYEPAAKGYVLPADPELVARVQAACQQVGLALHVPPTPALAVPLPPPSPHEVLLSRYCQHIALKRYSPNTLKSYRTCFTLFLAHLAPRLPLDLTKQDVLDYLSGRVAGAFPKRTRIRSSTPSNSITSRWRASPANTTAFLALSARCKTPKCWLSRKCGPCCKAPKTSSTAPCSCWPTAWDYAWAKCWP